MARKQNSVVEIKVNGQIYKLACNEGEEEHLVKLVNIINEEIENLISSVGKIDQNRLLLMAAIVIADKFDSLVNNKFDDLNNANLSKLSGAIKEANSRIELVAQKLSKI